MLTYAALWICVSCYDDLMGLVAMFHSGEIGIGMMRIWVSEEMEGSGVLLFLGELLF